MNDKEFNKLKSKIHKIIDKWSPMLGLKWWTVKIYYERVNCTDISRHDDGYSRAGAQTHVQYPYKTAQIYFYLPDLKSLGKQELENLVIHELIHILVNEMRFFNEGIDHEERVVSDLTSAFIWTYKRYK